MSLNDKKYTIFAIFFIIFLVVVAYANSIHNGLITDDFILSKEKFDDLWKITTSPFDFMIYLMYFVSNKIFGFSAPILRIQNILFHIGSVIFLFLFYKRITNFLTSFLTSILYAVHPILVESITWISGGVYPKYSLFFTTSLYLYTYSKNTYFYVISIFFFFITLSTSSKAVFLGLIFLIYDIFFTKRLRRAIPFIILMIIKVISIIPQIQPRLYEQNTILNFTNELFYNPFTQLPLALGTYIKLILIPNNLSFYHVSLLLPPTQKQIIEIIIFISFFCALLSYCVFRKNKIVSFNMALFTLALAPTMTSLKVSMLVAERYVYLSTFFLIGSIIYIFLKFLKTDLQFKIVIITTLTVTSQFCIKTIERNKDFKDANSIMFASIKTDPLNHDLNNEVGVYYLAKIKDYNLAEKYFSQAISLNPEYFISHFNLGMTYLKKNNEYAAEIEFNKAFRINPNLWQGYTVLGNYYMDRGRYDRSISYFLQALKIKSRDSQIHLALAKAYLKNNNSDEAKKELLKAIESNPKNLEAKNLLKGFQ